MLVGNVNRVQQGEVHVVGISSGQLRAARVDQAVVDYGAGAYEGDYYVTPGDEEQVLPTQGKRLTEDLVIGPIPSNYGRITWNGSTLTVS